MARGVYPTLHGRGERAQRRVALEARAADRRRLRRRVRRGLRGRLRGRRAVLLVLVQPRRARSARAGPRERPARPRRQAARDARGERREAPRLAAEDQPGDAEGDHRHRGPPLLREQRDRLHRDPAGARERRLVGPVRAGRIDHRAAARPQPLSQPAAVPRPEARRGVPCRAARPPLEQEPHPHGVPQRHLLRTAGVRDRGRRRRVLRCAREEPHARAGRAPRGAAAGAVGLRPAHAPARREGPPRGGARGDGQGG